MTIWDCLLSITLLRSIQIVACYQQLSLFIAEQYSVVCGYTTVFYLPILRHSVLSPLQFLAIINKISIMILSYWAEFLIKCMLLGHVMFRLSPFNAIIDMLGWSLSFYILSSVLYSFPFFPALYGLLEHFRIPFDLSIVFLSISLILAF